MFFFFGFQNEEMESNFIDFERKLSVKQEVGS